MARKALDILLEWSDRGRPRDCRIAALRSLATFVSRNEISEVHRNQLLERVTGCLQGEVPRIRRAAVETLRDLGSLARTATATVESLAEHDPDDRVRAAATAAAERMKNNDAPSQELGRLRKEIDSLRSRNRDLADRLLKLESK